MTVHDSAPAGMRTQADCQAVGGDSYPKTMQDFQLLKQASLKKQASTSTSSRATLAPQTSIGRTSLPSTHAHAHPQTPSDAGRSLLASRSMQSRTSPNPPNQAPPGFRTQADMKPVDNSYPKTMEEFKLMKQSSIKAQDTPTKAERSSADFHGNHVGVHAERTSAGAHTKTASERTSPGSHGPAVKADRSSLGSLAAPVKSAAAPRASPVQPKTPDAGRTLLHFQSLQNRSSGVANQAPPGPRTTEDVKPVGGNDYPRTVAELQQFKKQASVKRA